VAALRSIVANVRSAASGLQLAHKQMPARDDQTGLEGIRVVTEGLERLRRGGDGGHPRGQVTRRQRHLGLGHLTTRGGKALASAERSGSAAQQFSRPLVVAELGHRDSAQSQGWWIVSQRHALERTERITGGKLPRTGSNNGVHDGRLLQTR
jgi:hypothetical protein